MKSVSSFSNIDVTSNVITTVSLYRSSSREDQDQEGIKMDTLFFSWNLEIWIYFYIVAYIWFMPNNKMKSPLLDSTSFTAN